MTAQDDPDAIRADIERTRAQLSQNVDTLTETANPKNVAGRQVDKVKGAARNVREHLMGAPDDPNDGGTIGDAGGAVAGRASDLRHRAADTAGDLADRAGNAPHQVKRKAQGNPLAAGLIAFGIGYLISSAIPSSQREQQAAQRLQDKAEPLKEKLGETAHDLGDRLREPAQEAVESVRSTAGDAVSSVKDEGQSAKQEVTEQARSSSESVRES